MEEGLALPLLLAVLLLPPLSSSVPIVWSGDPGTVDGGVVPRAKRQNTATRNQTVGEFTDCSATCGGGFRVRSVRCLDEDGVIAFDCSLEERPASYQFCNQIDCVTNDPNTDLPPFDTYTFDLGNGSSAVLEFQAIPSGDYRVLLTVTEEDGTMTIVDQSRTASGVSTSVQIMSASNRIEFEPVDGAVTLVVDGERILGLEGVEVRDVTGSLRYNDSVISITPGNTTVDGVDTFYYFDGIRFYQFNTSMINPLSGPGTLYVNPVSRTALYTTSSRFSSRLSMVFDSLGINTIVVTSATSTDQSTSVPAATPTSVPATTPTGQPGPTVETFTITVVLPGVTTLPSTAAPTNVPRATTGVTPAPSGPLTTPTAIPIVSTTSITVPGATLNVIPTTPIPMVSPSMPDVEGGSKSGTRCTSDRTRTSTRSRESSSESRSISTRKSQSSSKRHHSSTSTRKSHTSSHSQQTQNKHQKSGGSREETYYVECSTLNSGRATPRKSSSSQIRGTQVQETSGKSQESKKRKDQEITGKTASKRRSSSRKKQETKKDEVKEVTRKTASKQMHQDSLRQESKKEDIIRKAARKRVTENLIKQRQEAKSVQKQPQKGSKNRLAWRALSQRMRWSMYRKLLG